MSDQEQHVTAWLGAYLDGEAQPALRALMEAHLEGCPACQRELVALRQLSALLQDSPAPRSPVSDREFARVVLSQITSPALPGWQRGLAAAWRCAPLFLFAGWAFFQAVQWVSVALLLGLRLAPGWQAWLPPIPAVGEGGLLLDLLRMSLPGGLAWPAFEELSGLVPFGSLALLNLAFVAVLAVLFLSWLASWWAYHRARLPGRPESRR